MLRVVPNAPMRAYQVRIKDEYLDKLYMFDAGSVEQEIFTKAENGLICIVTDRPETILVKLGTAVKSITYMGPLVDLPERFEEYANHWVTQRSRKSGESENLGSGEDLWRGIRAYPALARAFVARVGLFALFPLIHAAGSLIKKVSPRRAIRALRASARGS